MKQLLISLAFLCAALQYGQSQKSEYSSGDQIEIVTKDGGKIIGKVIKFTEDDIEILTASMGSATISKDQIRKITKLDIDPFAELDKNGFPIDFHGSTHYLVTPSAFSLKKGQAYYENIWIFWNSATFGVTDHFSISAGGEIASLLFAGRFPIIFVSPKISTNTGSGFEAALSTTFFTSPADDFNGFGVIQGLITLGNRSNNITIGSGIGFSSEEFSDDVVPITLSFMYRLSQKISLVSENFVIGYRGFEDSIGNISLATRIHFKKQGASLTAGLFRPLEDTGPLIAFPFVSASTPF